MIVSSQLPLGFGVAASVRVGNALGAGNAEQARHSSVTVVLCAGESKHCLPLAPYWVLSVNTHTSELLLGIDLPV